MNKREKTEKIPQAKDERKQGDAGGKRERDAAEVRKADVGKGARAGQKDGKGGDVGTENQRKAKKCVEGTIKMNKEKT